jgi:hypothetical protein
MLAPDQQGTNARPLAPTRQRGQTQSSVWTPEQDALLAQTVGTEAPACWALLLSVFPGKTAQQINDRWEKVLNPSLVKGSWTGAEDETILTHVMTHGAKDWVALAELLPGRIGKQCRERWINHLSPLVTRAAWSAEEDEKLIELHERFGNQWTVVASFFTGRTDNDVKNRWNSSLRLRVERRLKGEPEFRKRGRKPKTTGLQISTASNHEQMQTSSSCESPEPEIGFTGIEPPGFSLHFPPVRRTTSGVGANLGTVRSNREAFADLLTRSIA